jgi:hypothetical protein
VHKGGELLRFIVPIASKNSASGREELNKQTSPDFPNNGKRIILPLFAWLLVHSTCLPLSGVT